MAAAAATGDRWAKAEAAKNVGNTYFKEHNFVRAVVAYTEAIDLSEDPEDMELDSLDSLEAVEKDTSQRNPALHVYYSNRAFCHIKMENYGSALADSTKTIELDATYSKGWYRRGAAYLAMSKVKEAHKDFKALCKLDPSNKDARDKLNECEKIKRQLIETSLREYFAKAIASEKDKPLNERLCVDDIPHDASYAGPSFEAGGITAEFCRELMAYQKAEKTVSKRLAYQIVMEIITLLRSQPTLVDIEVPEGGEVTVCGDVHGQYYDLLNIWQMNGEPSETNPYLFNGDFVDRGSFSTEVILILFAWKLCYPNHLHLNRGNHETRNMNKLYGFEGEVVKKYDENLYTLFCEAFCLLPLCHVINRRVFCVHGGLFSKDNVTLDDLRKIDRDCEPPDEGLMHEMLWSDPHPGRGRIPSKRGVGVAFGADVTDNFCKTNGLKMVIRSHEMKEEGYTIEHDGKCITIFSAPNYCDQFANKGAFIRLDGKTMTPKYTSFAHVPHPNVWPMQYANPMLGRMMGM